MSVIETQTPPPTQKRVAQPRRRVSPGRVALQVGCFAVAVGFVAVTAVDPYSGAVASSHFTVEIDDTYNLPTQALTVAGGEYQNTASRDTYKSEAPPPPPPKETPASSGGFRPPAQAVPDPGTAKAIAYEKVMARGWSQGEYDCLVALWNRESGWRVNAMNASSGAYGIPQSLPGSKMASAGDDWQTNPATQIEWGLGYIAGRYGSPCGAWDHSERKNWY